MDAAAHLILTLSSLVLFALAAAAAGARIGAPLLLIFLAVGLLAGPEGPGGITLERTDIAFAAASAALAVILLDGGLRTRPETLALGFRPGLVLATAGVALTATITGGVAMIALDMGWRESLLVGAIVSSTDAAAVFAMLGARGEPVRERLAASLETESGMNDPTAVFLTLALATALASPAPPGAWGLISTLAWQIVAGAACGLIAGRALAWIKPRIPLAAGLKPILTLAGGLFAFAFTQSIGGSGFLAVYFTGLVQAREARGVQESEARALDGFAWLAQILLFLVLGMLATPSHLFAVLGPAIAIAAGLIFIARPIAVFASLQPFGFRLRERAFASWTGLRGATPIFLGLIPAAVGAPNANLYFSIAVVIAAVSLVAQGWTTPAAARFLGVTADGDGEGGVDLRSLGPARLSAVGLALAAFVGASLWVARDIAPAPTPSWRPVSVVELETRLERARDVGPDALPPDWAAIEDPARRQRLFIDALRPLIDVENTRVLVERAEVERFASIEASGRNLGFRDQARRDVLARQHGVAYDDLNGLLVRIDATPASLTIAQAALTTGWGTSAPALEANALFGRRPGDQTGVSDAYENLGASVADYIDTLNRHPAFAEFRAARAAARAEGREPTGVELTPHVAPFAADGEAFARGVIQVIETSGLEGPASEEARERP